MKDSLLGRLSSKIKRVSKKLFYYFCFLFPIKKYRIICDNFCGNSYNDNPKYIVEELLKNTKKLNIYWALNKQNFNNNLPDYINKVKYNSFKFFYILATSKIWIDNVRMPIKIKKRKGQFYVQTWHGGLGFKKIEKDAVDTLPDSYITCAINDSKNIDLLLTNCKWQEDYFKKFFWYDRDILVEGLPRNDILVNKDMHDEIYYNIRNKFNIEKDTKIIMYAPTFRNNHNFDCYNINFNKLISLLEKKYSCKWKILVRLHPNMSNYKFDCVNTIDVTKYSNLNDLLIASDLLISDYSSIIIDYSIQEKPAFIYAKDIDEYTSERGLAIDFKKVPYPISTNNDELLNNIDNFDNNKYLKDLKKFFDNNGLNETGLAAEKVARIILDYIKK